MKVASSTTPKRHRKSLSIGASIKPPAKRVCRETTNNQCQWVKNGTHWIKTTVEDTENLPKPEPKPTQKMKQRDQAWIRKEEYEAKCSQLAKLELDLEKSNQETERLKEKLDEIESPTGYVFDLRERIETLSEEKAHAQSEVQVADKSLAEITLACDRKVSEMQAALEASNAENARLRVALEAAEDDVREAQTQSRGQFSVTKEDVEKMDLRAQMEDCSMELEHEKMKKKCFFCIACILLALLMIVLPMALWRH